MRKTLRNMIGTCSLALAIAGCGYPEYHFKGKIDGEHVIYEDQDIINSRHRLTVTKNDGREIEYVSSGFIEPVCWIYITKRDGSRELYKEVDSKSGDTDPAGQAVLEEGNKQFSVYLSKILEEKERIQQDRIKRALEDIK